MMKKHALISGSRRSVILGATLLAGAAFGLGLASQIYAPPAGADPASEELFPVNESGQTYGSLADAPSDEQAPDLILVELEDGTEAYILSEDLFAAEGGDVDSPEEAVEYMNQKNSASRGVASEGSAGEDLPIYNRDGNPLAEDWGGLDTSTEGVIEE